MGNVSQNIEENELIKKKLSIAKPISKKAEGLISPKNSSYKEIQDNKKKTYKEKVMSKIKKTIKDNILRNARRVAFPLYQSHS